MNRPRRFLPHALRRLGGATARSATSARVCKARRVLLGAAVALLGAGSARAADAWPDHSIRWIVPYVAGGLSDTLSRIVAEKLSQRLGQAVVIDNRTGAGGNIGTDMVAKASPDGYTLLLGNIGPIAVSPSLYPHLPYDPEKDLQPVSLLISYPNILATSNSFEPRTLAEFVRYAKTHDVPYATSGVGTSLHLAGELFKRTAGIRLSHVPYRGGNSARMDLMSGVVPATFEPIFDSVPAVKSGKIRAIAVTSATRSPLLPDVPTVAESGYAGFDVNGWIGVLVPHGTPPAITNRLAEEIAAILKMPDVAARIAEWGAVVPTLGPDYFGRYIQTETKRWHDVITEANIRVE